MSAATMTETASDTLVIETGPTDDRGRLGEPMFHARVKGQPEHWAVGRSPEEAIGWLIQVWGDRFGVRAEGVQS